jgi:hypothetical protein
MVLILVFGCGLGWFAHKVQQARAQQEAVKAIRKLGGSVVEEPSDGVIRTAVAGVGKLFGEDLSGDVTGVSFGGTQVTDAGLVHLRGLTQLEWLTLHSTQVTDAGLVHVRGLTRLQGLNLSSTQVTDAGLEHLRGLTRLTYLHLSNTQVTDASVNELKKVLPNLYVGR